MFLVYHNKKNKTMLEPADENDDKQLQLSVEAIVFAAEKSVSSIEIKVALEALWDTTIEFLALDAAVENLLLKYRGDEYPFEVVEISGGLRFLSKGAYHGAIGSFLKQSAKKKLTTSALETLAVIAYKQPITKTEVEQIRGVNCDYTVQKLLEKELLSIIGRSDAPGRPLLYGTSNKFMDYFGIHSLEDLPRPKDFAVSDNEIGAATDIVSDVN